MGGALTETEHHDHASHTGPAGLEIAHESHPVDAAATAAGLSPEVAPGVRPGRQRDLTPLERTLQHAIVMWQNRHRATLERLNAAEATLEAVAVLAEETAVALERAGEDGLARTWRGMLGQ